MYRQQTFPGSVATIFVGPLRQALPSLPLPPPLEAAVGPRSHDDAVKLELFGPFPIVTAPASKIRQAGSISAVARSVGWRALFIHDDVPLAVVDVGPDWRSGGMGHVRGAEVAQAFHAALKVAAQEAHDRNWSKSHTLKLLKIPHVYLSALWLAGRPAFFIPTRLGTPGRPPYELWRPSHLIEEIDRLERIHARRAKRVGTST
jgi:hypothetical protein